MKPLEKIKILEQGEKLNFEPLTNKRIYNPSRPFKINDELYIFARVEDKTTNESQSRLFKFNENENSWQIVKDFPVFNLEDPFLTFFEEGVLFGGVYVEWENKVAKFLQTIFYFGETIFDLSPDKPFAHGPKMMKDIRVVKLKRGFGVFTRPWGGKYLKGRICYIEIDDLEKLNDDKIYESAQLVDLSLNENEWAGSNDVYYLDENKIGVLGHYAYFDDKKNKHYVGITFIFEPQNFEVKNLRLIAERKDFPQGPAKERDLEDVIFPGGLYPSEDGNYFLYCGLSDEEIGRIKIKNPFIG